MDLRLENSTIFQIVGPSGSGKSLFVTKLLASRDMLFKNRVKNVYWMQGAKEAGDTLENMKELKNVIYIEGFVRGWQDKPHKGDILIIDDLFQEANNEKDFDNLFTKIVRHRGVTVIFITQNMFHQGGQHRTRNLNVHYRLFF